MAIVLALKQCFHLLRGQQQVHVHTDHESLRYLKTCPRQLTPRQARWSQFLKEYNLTLWYVPCLENPTADACSRLTSSELMDIENATRTRPFVVPLIENWVSPEGEPVDKFLHVLEDLFSHDEVGPRPYNHLYVSPRSGRSVGKDSEVDADAEPALQFDTEPAVEPEEVEPLPNQVVVTKDPHEPAARLDDAGNEIPDQSTDPNDVPEVDMDRPLRVPLGKQLQYAPPLTELIHCRRHRDGTPQPVPLPKVGPSTPYPSSLKGTHHRVHRHYQGKDLTSTAVWAAAYSIVYRGDASVRSAPRGTISAARVASLHAACAARAERKQHMHNAQNAQNAQHGVLEADLEADFRHMQNA